MAHIMTKRGNLDNIVTYEHMCDQYDDLQNISMDERTLGSVALVLRGQSGGVEIYMTDSNKQWALLTMGSGNSDSNSSNSGSSEFIKYVDTLPTEDINPDVIYIVKDENDKYTQYMYIDDAWQNLGTTTPEDLNKQTLNMKNGTGSGAVVEGLEKWEHVDSKTGETIISTSKNYASGDLSHAEGNKTKALAAASHAQGQNTTADIGAVGSHVEGFSTKTGAPYSHAEGVRSIAAGNAAHAEGRNCIALAQDSHAENQYTRAFARGSHVQGGGTYATQWERYTHISGVNNDINDVAQDGDTRKTVKITAHTLTGDVATDSTGKPLIEQLFLGKYAEVVGNGLSEETRSNARTLDWYGNSYVAGETISCGDIIARPRTTTSRKSDGTVVSAGTGGNLIAEGGSLTLISDGNAVTITAEQLQALLDLLVN